MLIFILKNSNNLFTKSRIRNISLNKILKIIDVDGLKLSNKEAYNNKLMLSQSMRLQFFYNLMDSQSDFGFYIVKNSNNFVLSCCNLVSLHDFNLLKTSIKKISDYYGFKIYTPFTNVIVTKDRLDKFDIVKYRKDKFNDLQKYPLHDDCIRLTGINRDLHLDESFIDMFKLYDNSEDELNKFNYKLQNINAYDLIPIIYTRNDKSYIRYNITSERDFIVKKSIHSTFKKKFDGFKIYLYSDDSSDSVTDDYMLTMSKSNQSIVDIDRLLMNKNINNIHLLGSVEYDDFIKEVLNYTSNKIDANQYYI